MIELMNIDDIAALYRVSRRHARDVMVLARISRHRDLQILMDHYYRVTPSEIAQRI